MFDEKRFRAALIMKGLSMTEMADKLGINPATLYRKTTGASDFTRGELLKIREILNLSPDQFEQIFFAA